MSQTMTDYFSDFANDGEILSVMEDGIGTFVSLIPVESDDITAFPELFEEGNEVAFMLFTQDDQGFKEIEEIRTIDELAEVRSRFTESDK